MSTCQLKYRGCGYKFNHRKKFKKKFWSKEEKNLSFEVYKNSQVFSQIVFRGLKDYLHKNFKSWFLKNAFTWQKTQKILLFFLFFARWLQIPKLIFFLQIDGRFLLQFYSIISALSLQIFSCKLMTDFFCILALNLHFDCRFSCNLSRFFSVFCGKIFLHFNGIFFAIENCNSGQ